MMELERHSGAFQEGPLVDLEIGRAWGDTRDHLVPCHVIEVAVDGEEDGVHRGHSFLGVRGAPALVPAPNLKVRSEDAAVAGAAAVTGPKMGGSLMTEPYSCWISFYVYMCTFKYYTRKL